MANKAKDENLIMEEIGIRGYEKVIKVTNHKANLNALIAIHSTYLGPSIGGIRIYPYKDFDGALRDVLRLSKGMTYKSAISEVGFGGAKSVIIADPSKDKNEAMLLAFAGAVDELEGSYICAEDVGCNVNDVMIIRNRTKYVTGLPHKKSSGDPSPFTAWGTYRGIQSVLMETCGNESVQGKRIAIQGIGSVGSHLIDLLFWNGAEIIASDIDTNKLDIVARKYGVESVGPEEILNVECDVLAPCALGGVLNEKSIPTLRCKAIAGCANNQLLKDEDGDLLHERKILYAPDFVINAGGLINVSLELNKDGYCPKQAKRKINDIFNVLSSIYEISRKNNISTSKAANDLADYKLKYGIGKRTKLTYFHH